MKFKKVFLKELSPARYNPRKDLQPNDPEYQAIKRSIEEFGYVDPIIVNSDYTVIGGHQRLKVLKELGQAQIDVVVVDIPKQKEKALNVALNKISGDWDQERLAILLQEIKADGFLDLAGFDDKEFDQLLRDIHKDDEPLDTEPQISRAEELRKQRGTELGQMWQCGEHRVICGDCTDPGVVKRVMGDEKVDMVFTDPPYNIDYQDLKKKHSKIKNDNKSDYDFKKFLTSALKGIPETSYICCNWMTYSIFKSILEEIKRPVKSCIVWDKENPAQNLDKYYKQHEFVLYTGKLGGEKTLRGDVWRIPRGKSDMHPTMKPIELVAMAISDNPSAAAVLDPFLGSGTTMIACENLGRKCRGCEIDPSYVAVILQRYKDTFGKEPVLIQDNSGIGKP